MHSWRVLILPFIEQHAVYEQYDFSQPWNSPSNSKLADQMPQMYAFHETYRPGLTETNYLAVVGKETIWPGSVARASLDVSDDRETTILLVENHGQKVHWMEPRDLDFNTMDFQINSPAGVSSVYEDPAVVTDSGQVYRLGDVSKETLRAFLTANGGEVVPKLDEAIGPLSDGRDRPIAASID